MLILRLIIQVSMFLWCKDILLQAVTNIRVLNHEQINCDRESLYNTLEATMLSLELVYQEFTAAEFLEGRLHSHEYEAMHFVKHAYEILRNIYERGINEEEGIARGIERGPLPIRLIYLRLYPSRSVGRPKFVIPHTQLLYLIENRFTIAQIAKMLGVSERTIYRRMADFGYSVSEQYSDCN